MQYSIQEFYLDTRIIHFSITITHFIPLVGRVPGVPRVGVGRKKLKGVSKLWLIQSPSVRVCVFQLVAFHRYFLMLLFLSRVSAQVVGATISGTVTDTSGSKMPSVDIVDHQRRNRHHDEYHHQRRRHIHRAQPAAGQLRNLRSQKGFSTLVRKGITLTVGQELILNLSLQVGSVNEQVTVTADAPTVNLANATISGVIEQRTVQELPLNGRSWTDLAILQPGVHQSQDQPPITAGDRVKRGLGLELTISGARPQQNNYLLDGVNINDYANAGPGSVLGGNLGTDAVAEFCGADDQLLRRIRPHIRRRHHRHHQVRHQSVPRKRL